MNLLIERLVSWWTLFERGGPLMFPIFLCSVAALAIMFERLWTLRSARVIPEKIVRETTSLLKDGKVDEARALLAGSDTSIARIVAMGLSKAEHGREEAREALEDAGRMESHRLGQFINMLGGIAGVSPLLGLLGTVFGMIDSFHVIATRGVGSAGDVAGGIAMALITTAAGLSVAIPAFIANRYFMGRVDGLMAQLEEQSIEFLHLIEDASKAGGEE